MKTKGNLISLRSVIFILFVGMAMTGCATTTPLMSAANSGDINTVKDLLNKGADVNEISDNITVLMTVALKGQTEIVKLLIERGADVNGKGSGGTTVLMTAALKGHTEIVKLLIERGADVNAIDSAGVTALLLAAKFRHTETVKLLIERGADVEQALTNLESSSDPQGQAGAHMLKRLTEKKKTASQAISKEDLKTIVQAAVESATQAQKPETKTAIKTDIDSPSFNPSQIVMGDNDLAVIIGIEGYQGLPKSDFSYDDAKLVKEYAKALGFKERNIELLTDEKATKSSIEKSLEAWLKNKAKPDSRIFVYYSGHGAPDAQTGEAYLVPYDGDPNYLEVTGYPLKRLYDKLGKLQAAEVIVLLDSCFSGAGGRSVLAKGARPLVMMTDASVISSNMAVLSATQGTQISTSSPEKGHGVFTYYFLKAIKDGRKNIAEIYEYIKPLVEDEAKQLNVQQSPSINPDAEKLKGRFGLRK